MWFCSAETAFLVGSISTGGTEMTETSIARKDKGVGGNPGGRMGRDEDRRQLGVPGGKLGRDLMV